MEQKGCFKENAEEQTLDNINQSLRSLADESNEHFSRKDIGTLRVSVLKIDQKQDNLFEKCKKTLQEVSLLESKTLEELEQIKNSALVEKNKIQEKENIMAEKIRKMEEDILKMQTNIEENEKTSGLLEDQRDTLMAFKLLTSTTLDYESLAPEGVVTKHDGLNTYSTHFKLDNTKPEEISKEMWSVLKVFGEE